MRNSTPTSANSLVKIDHVFLLSNSFCNQLQVVTMRITFDNAKIYFMEFNDCYFVKFHLKLRNRSESKLWWIDISVRSPILAPDIKYISEYVYPLLNLFLIFTLQNHQRPLYTVCDFENIFPLPLLDYHFELPSSLGWWCTKIYSEILTLN